MTSEQMVKRLIQLRSGENMKALLDMQMQFGPLPGRAAALEAAALTVEESKFDFYDQKPATIDNCLSELRRAHAAHRIGLAVLDYDELLDLEVKKHGARSRPST